MNLKATLRSRVQRGARWLDTTVPGWFRLINIDQLDMHSGEFSPGEECGCIAAQLDYQLGTEDDDYGEYDEFFADHPLSPSKEVSHGFVIDERESEDEGDITRLYALLDAFWTNEILNRDQTKGS